MRVLQGFKIWIVSFIAHPMVGRLIARIVQNRMNRHGADYRLESPLISNRVKALIFWNLYEKAEIQFIQAYLTGDYPVIELGGSLGITSAVIGKQIGHQLLITVEANPDLIPIIENHLAINKRTNYEVVHAGIGAQGALFFVKGNDNTVGKVSSGFEPGAIPVPVKTLSRLLEERELDAYSLVSDIEGAELSFIFEIPDALNRCKKLIIELHNAHWNGKLITVKEQISQLENIGFRIVAQHGPVICATK
jgi:FkbM family methyltransferase